MTCVQLDDHVKSSNDLRFDVRIFPGRAPTIVISLCSEKEHVAAFPLIQNCTPAQFSISLTQNCPVLMPLKCCRPRGSSSTRPPAGKVQSVAPLLRQRLQTSISVYILRLSDTFIVFPRYSHVIPPFTAKPKPLDLSTSPSLFLDLLLCTPITPI